jgi:hypothetical protein
MKYITDLFTCADNKTWSMSKLLVFVGAVTMCGEFAYKGSVDFQGFAIGIAAIVAALAAKTYVDPK